MKVFFSLLFSISSGIIFSQDFRFYKEGGSDYVPFDISMADSNHVFIVGARDDLSQRTPVISKMSIQGDVIWEKQYTTNSYSSFKKTTLCSNNELIGLIDLWENYAITRLNKDGELQWTKAFSDTSFSYASILQGVTTFEKEDSSIITFGRYNATSTCENCAPKFHLSNLDPQGNVLWSKRYCSPHNGHSFSALDIIETNNGNLLLTLSGSRFVELNASGDILNQWAFDAPLISNIGIRQLSDGSYFICGKVDEIIRVIKFDAQFTPIWQYSLESSPNHYSRISDLVITDDRLTLVGQINSYDTIQPFQNRGLLISLDYNGTILQSQMYSRGGKDKFSAAIPTQNNSILITGDSRATVNSYRDLLFGNIDSTHVLDCNVYPVTFSKTLIPLNSGTPITLTPSFTIPLVNFDIATTDGLKPTPEFCSTVTVQENTHEEQLITFDPFEKVIQFNVHSEFIGTDFLLFDQLGKIIMNETIQTKTNTLNVELLPKGIYYFQLSNGQRQKLLLY